MATSLEDKLARLPADRCAKVETRAAELIAEEMARRELRPTNMASSRARASGLMAWRGSESRSARASMPAGRLPATLAALLTALALAACGSIEETMIERGHPPAYAAGYADGCASGKAAAGGVFAEARKDASRYDADSQYTQGWDVGFEECRADMAAMVLDARLRNPSRDN